METNEFDALTPTPRQCRIEPAEALRGLGGALLSGAFAGVAGRGSVWPRRRRRSKALGASRRNGKRHGGAARARTRARRVPQASGSAEQRRRFRLRRRVVRNIGPVSSWAGGGAPMGRASRQTCAALKCFSSLPRDACESPICEQGAWHGPRPVEFRHAGRCVNPRFGHLHLNPQTCQCECPSGRWSWPTAHLLSPGAGRSRHRWQGTICCGGGDNCVGVTSAPCSSCWNLEPNMAGHGRFAMPCPLRDSDRLLVSRCSCRQDHGLDRSAGVAITPGDDQLVERARPLAMRWVIPAAR